MRNESERARLKSMRVVDGGNQKASPEFVKIILQSKSRKKKKKKNKERKNKERKSTKQRK